MPTRQSQQHNYRYGFQGQEKDDEISGNGNSYSAEFWKYDSRVARRWEIDPILKFHESPYAAFANNPVWFNDWNGADTGLVILFKHHESVAKQKSALENDPDNENYGVYVATSFEDGLKVANAFAKKYGKNDAIGIVFRYHGVNDPNGGVMNFVGPYIEDPDNEGEMIYNKDYSINSGTFNTFAGWIAEAEAAGEEFNLEYVKKNKYATDKGEFDSEKFDKHKPVIMPLMTMYELGQNLDDNDFCAFTHCNLGYGTKGQTTAQALGAIMPTTTVYINVGATKAIWQLSDTKNYGMLDLPLSTGNDGKRGWMVINGPEIKLKEYNSIILQSSGSLIGWHKYKGKGAYKMDTKVERLVEKILKKKYN